MPLMKPLTIESAGPEAGKVLEGIKAHLGKIPNIFATLAHSPVALQSFLAHGDALKKGALTAREVESVALVVGERNDCHYCVSAHSVIGKMAGLNPEEIKGARAGKNGNEKLNALLKLSGEIVETKGRPSEGSVQAFFKVGYSEAALVEVIALVAHNIFTNYFNHINDTEIDFPKAEVLK